jgi:hypothetical protein
MIWVANKNDLSYYSGVPERMCYCENLSAPSDMLLQGSWNGITVLGGYSASVEVWSVDGNTALEVISPSLYDIYFAKNPLTGQHFFTFRLKSYSPVMCTEKCFLIRIGITGNGSLVFAAWTERYCITNCCDVPRGIIMGSSSNIEIVPIPEAVLPEAECGEAMIRVISSSDCYNAFSNDYFGQPSVIFSGTYIPYFKISIFRGRKRRLPRDIEIQRSYNCRIQRIETARQWQLISPEYFPEWKMDELEAQFASSKIWIDDFSEYTQYQFEGGAVFARRDLRSTCVPIYQLTATVQECITRQTFGCVSTCVDTAQAYYFVVPDSYSGGYFFNQQGQIIANDPVDGASSLVNWLQAQGLTTTVIENSPKPCAYNSIIQVEGDIIPSVVYYDQMTLQNALNPIFADITDICSFIPNAYCQGPVLGTIVFGDAPCDAPLLGVISYGDIPTTNFNVYAFTPWSTVISNSGEVTAGVATINFNIEKTVGGMNGDSYGVMNEIICTIDPAGYPTAPRIITTGVDDIGNISAGWQVVVDTDGTVRFTGTVELVADNILNLKMNDLIYSI